MQNKIWNKASKDTLGLKNYFDTNKTLYKEASLEKIKGKVASDYQKYLEKTWIKELRTNNTIEIKKKTLKKFKKNYK